MSLVRSAKLGDSVKNLLGAVRSRKSRSDSSSSDAATNSVRIAHVTPKLMGAELGAASTPELQIAALNEQVAELQRRLANVSATVPKADGILAVKQGMAPLRKGADAAAALAYATEACGTEIVVPSVAEALLTLLRDSSEHAHLGLPQKDDELCEYARRMFMLADVGRDGALDAREFALFWRHLPTSRASSVLGARFGARFVAGTKHFVFGSRKDWVGGLQQKLGTLVKRSLEAECMTNDGGAWKKRYEYIVKKAAKSEQRPQDGSDAHGEPITFDEGHDGKRLEDFRQLAEGRGALLTLAETAALRMYTADVRATPRRRHADATPTPQISLPASLLARLLGCCALPLSAVLRPVESSDARPRCREPARPRPRARAVGDVPCRPLLCRH
jgi:hypothetical protein